MSKVLKVLIVDDTPEIREISQFYFESLAEKFGPFVFFEAKSGKEAIQAINQHPDLGLVFSDYNMPNGNGLFVLTELRKTNQAPFILHSGDDWETFKSSHRFENVYHAAKPLDIAKLQRILEKVFPEVQKKAG